LQAQGKTIRGTVTDDSGEALIGANVLVKGGSRGTVTDLDGKFSLKVRESDQVLVISYVGYATLEVPIPGTTDFNFVLSESVELEQIVVTALGVERSEKALGYAVQEIEGSEISQVKPTNLANALAGKVSGVYITGSGNGPTASTNVTIRGQSSLTGSSQALFVVNGIPITNGLFSPGDGLNGSTTIDFGNASQIISPDDIASISVLKGPAAAALYGSRAANGVILVTTKTGKASDGWGVEINSNVSMETILRLPDFQNEYGFGGYGFYSYNGGTTYTAGGNGAKYYDAFGENWGPRLDGTPIVQWDSDGEPVPFTPAENNVRNFFRTGITSINNLAISNSTKTSDFRLSYTNTSRRGIVPNSNLNRNAFFTSMGKSMFDSKLELRLNTMYVRSSSDNVPNAGYDESSSVMYGWLWYPRQVPIEDLEDYWKPGQENEQQRYVEELWVNNPWLVANENTNAFQENRIIGNARLLYHFTDNLNLRFRFGADIKDDQRQYRRATSTKAVLFGSYREDELSFSETNTELLLSWNSERSKRFVVDLKAGGNIMRQQSNILSAFNPQLLQPGVFTLTNNRSDILVENPRAQKGINSLFGLASFSFDNFLYLDISGRNDWSSTLPAGNNSYFYPSVSLSALVSEMLDIPTTSALSFLKLRAAYAEVGSDTGPYQLRNFYEPEPLFGSYPAFSVSAFAANPDLRPERTSALEFGLDLRFADSRLGLDLAYYDMLSEDQIIFLPVATTSGKQTRLANAGAIRNRGVELSLYAQPVRTNNFSWDITLNRGHNRAIVEELPAGIEDSYPIIPDVYPGDEGSANMELVAIEGELLGQIWGLGFLRDADGNIVHDNGLPLLTKDKVSAGSYQPDLRAGLYNTFSVGNFSLGILFDGQFGGKIYSRTHALMNTGGTITNNDDPLLPLSTLDGRDDYDITYDNDGNPVYTGDPGQGVIGPGVQLAGYDENGNPLTDAEGNVLTSGANATAAPTRDYFYAYYGNGFNRDNVEAATYDATYIKLREMRLSYRLPQSALDNLGMSNVSLSLIGRNLLLFTQVPSIDPETYSIRNGLFVNGFESTQLPSTRSFGIALNASF
jgi:TonB-linked SusC/RagA family outer membrane protein